MKKDSALIRLVRLSKWLILFAALASFASISALYIVVSPKWVEEKLEDFSSKKLDLHIKLDGQITIKHLPKIEVTLPKGTLTDTTDNSYLGSFSSGTIRISPWGLLIGQLHISSITLDGLNSAIASPDQNELQHLSRSPLIQDTDSWIAPVVVKKLILTNAQVAVNGLRPEPVQVQIASLETGEVAPRMTAPVTFNASFTSPADKITANVEGNGNVDLDLRSKILGLPQFRIHASGTAQSSPFDATVQTENFQYVQGVWSGKQLAASVSTTGKKQNTYQLSVEDLSTQNHIVRGRISKLSAVQSLESGTQSLSVSSPFSVDMDKKSYSLDQMQLGYVLAADTAPAIQASLTGTARGNWADQTLQLDTKGKLNDAPLSISLQGSSLESPKIDTQIVAKKIDLTPKEETAPATLSWESIPSEIAVPLIRIAGTATVHATVSIEELSRGALRASAVSSHIALSRDSLTISDFSADLRGGHVTGNLSFDPSGSWMIRAKAAQIAAGDRSAPDSLSGTLNLLLTASGPGDPDQIMTKSLKGDADIELTNGNMPGLGRKALPFTSLSCPVVIHDGIASTGSLKAAGHDFTAKGRAEIDLQTLSVAGEAVVWSALQQKSSPATLDGSVSRPVWSLIDPMEFLPVEPQPAPKAAAPAAPAALKAAAPAASESVFERWFRELKEWVLSKF